MHMILLDTGPLVALLEADDHHHQWTVQQLRIFSEGTLVTCDAVLSEALFIVSDQKTGAKKIRLFVESGWLRSGFDSTLFVGRALSLMESYANVPMSYADACLVAMSEQQVGARIFTLDRDFQIYRQHGRKVIPLVAPYVN